MTSQQTNLLPPPARYCQCHMPYILPTLFTILMPSVMLMSSSGLRVQYAKVDVGEVEAQELRPCWVINTTINATLVIDNHLQHPRDSDEPVEHPSRLGYHLCSVIPSLGEISRSVCPISSFLNEPFPHVLLNSRAAVRYWRLCRTLGGRTVLLSVRHGFLQTHRSRPYSFLDALIL